MLTADCADGAKITGARRDFAAGIAEVVNFSAGSVNLNPEIGRSTMRLAKTKYVLAPATRDMAENSVRRRSVARFRNY